jgi:hypothetical protein
MHSHRTTARGVTFLLLLWVLAGSANAGAARGKGVPDLLFPVVGSVDYRDDFGEARGQGRHEGNDILGDRRAPVVAVEDGKVRFWTTSSRAGCMLYLYGKSGTTYLYIHLNNDLTDRNDNRGGCVNGVAFPRGLRDGARVLAGQPIGFVGDSGDANGIHPHLHFERHPHGGRATNPYPYLIAARRLLFYAPPGQMYTLTLAATVVSTSQESLRVRVNTLRTHPAALVLRRLNRPLTLTVPSYATIERGQGGATAALASAKRGDRVAVWTEPAMVTAEAQAGKAGVISADRIVLPAP